jgi:hypothetical protein
MVMNSKIQDLKDYKIFTKPSLHDKIDLIVELYKNRTIENIKTAKNLADKLSSRGLGPKRAVEIIDSMYLRSVYVDMQIINPTTKRSSFERKQMYLKSHETEDDGDDFPLSNDLIELTYNNVDNAEEESILIDFCQIYPDPEPEHDQMFEFDEIYVEPEINEMWNPIRPIMFDEIYVEPEINEMWNPIRPIMFEFDDIYNEPEIKKMRNPMRQIKHKPVNIIEDNELMRYYKLFKYNHLTSIDVNHNLIYSI